ncbi:MAG: pilus assembly protein [Lachnospiraceae bacterium]|nr:pilus assembly protein [Lachnospiraceae bacterium]MDD3794960.1 pilus assembly protein [Lachnospiraceae bacterium]
MHKIVRQRETAVYRKGAAVKGSFTVEAALIMSILLPVLVALILSGFLVHDRAVLQGAACEVTAMGCNLTQESNQKQMLDQLRKRLSSSRLLWTKGVTSKISVDKNKISVSYSGTFYIPGLIMKLISQNTLKIGKKSSRAIFHPADTIRKIRGVKHLISTIT